MFRLLAILTTLYLASLAAVFAIGLRPNLPWLFLGAALLEYLPLIFCVTSVGDWLEQRLGSDSQHVPWTCLPLGLLLVLGYEVFSSVVVALVVWVLILWDPQRSLRSLWGRYLLCLLALLLALAVVWNLNYVVGWLWLPRVHDATMLGIDLEIYSRLLGAVESAGLYPLWQSPVAFRLFENAYFMMFPEIFLVVYVLLRARANVTQFLASLFACYSLGVLVFLVYPVVGPYYHAPSSMDPAYHGSLTYQVMQKLVAEYAAICRGAALNGYGYCVGLPSLHVGLAVLMQVSLLRLRFYFWLLLPLNVLLICATLYLGFHYVLDVLGGILVTCTVLALQWLWHRWRRRDRMGAEDEEPDAEFRGLLLSSASGS